MTTTDTSAPDGSSGVTAGAVSGDLLASLTQTLAQLVDTTDALTEQQAQLRADLDDRNVDEDGQKKTPRPARRRW